MATLRGIIVRIRGDATGLVRAVEQARAGLGSLVRNAEGASRAVTAAVAGLGAALAGVGVAAVRAAAQHEQTRIAFENMLGSAEQAAAFLRDLERFAARTPFELPQLERAARQLLAFGFAAQDILPMLRAVGDAVAGLGGGADMIDRVIRALGQMAAKGKVSAEEMMQLAEAGIPAWQMLAEAIGTDIPTAMKMAERGAIAAGTAIEALVRGMQSRFGGMMQQQSRTLLGLWSNLRDNVSQLMRRLGEEVVEALDLRGALEQMVALSEAVRESLERTGLREWLAQVREQVVLLAGAIGGALTPAIIGLARGVVSIVRRLGIWVAIGAVAAETALQLGASFRDLGRVVQGLGQALYGLGRILQGVIRFFATGIADIVRLVKGIFTGEIDWQKLAEQNISQATKFIEDFKQGFQALKNAITGGEGGAQQSSLLLNLLDRIKKQIDETIEGFENIGSFDLSNIPKGLQPLTTSIDRLKQLQLQFEVGRLSASEYVQQLEALRKELRAQVDALDPSTEEWMKAAEQYRDVARAIQEIQDQARAREIEGLDAAFRTGRISARDYAEQLRVTLAVWEGWLAEMDASSEAAQALAQDIERLRETLGRLSEWRADSLISQLWRLLRMLDDLNAAFNAAEAERWAEAIGNAVALALEAAGQEGYAQVARAAGSVVQGLFDTIKKLFTDNRREIERQFAQLGDSLVLISQNVFAQITSRRKKGLFGLFGAREYRVEIDELARTIAQVLDSSVSGALRSGIQSFLEGSRTWLEDLRRGIRDAISSAIAEAVVRGAIVQGALGSLLEQLVTQLRQGAFGAAQQTIAQIAAAVPLLARQLEGLLAPLRGALAGLYESASSAASAISAMTAELTNVPQGFKVALARYQAIIPEVVAAVQRVFQARASDLALTAPVQQAAAGMASVLDAAASRMVRVPQVLAEAAAASAEQMEGVVAAMRGAVEVLQASMLEARAGIDGMMARLKAVPQQVREMLMRLSATTPERTGEESGGGVTTLLQQGVARVRAALEDAGVAFRAPVPLLREVPDQVGALLARLTSVPDVTAAMASVVQGLRTIPAQTQALTRDAMTTVGAAMSGAALAAKERLVAAATAVGTHLTTAMAAAVDGLAATAELARTHVLRAATLLARQLEGLLAPLGAALADVRMAASGAAVAVGAATAELASMPQAFGAALARYQAIVPEMASGAPQTQLTIVFEGPVYGSDDLERRIDRAARAALERISMERYASPVIPTL